MYYQKQAVVNLSADSFRAWLGNIAMPNDFYTTMQAETCLPEDAQRWQETLHAEALEYPPEARRTLANSPLGLLAIATSCSGEKNWPSFIAAVRNATAARGKALFSVLRAALTGRLDGPPLPQIYAWIPAELKRKRFLTAHQISTSETHLI